MSKTFTAEAEDACRLFGLHIAMEEYVFKVDCLHEQVFYRTNRVSQI